MDFAGIFKVKYENNDVVKKTLKIIIISCIAVGVAICVSVLEFYLGVAKGLTGYLGFAGLFAYVIYMIIRWVRRGPHPSDLTGMGWEDGGGGHGGGSDGGGGHAGYG